MTGKRIHRLSIEGFMGIAFADFALAPTVVELSGKNGSGKSSVLNAIAAAIEIKAKRQKEPIRKGWERAKILVHVGGAEVETIITRQFDRIKDDEVTTRLTAQTADGIPLARPSDILRGISSDGPIDPLKFMVASEKDQLDALKQFVDGVEWDVVEARRQEIFNARTGIGRDLKRVTGSIDQLISDLRAAPPAGRPAAVILADINARNAIAAAHDRWSEAAERIVADRSRIEHDVKLAVERRDRAQTLLTEEIANLRDCMNRRDALPSSPMAEPPRPLDGAALQAEMVASHAQAGVQAKRDQLCLLRVEREGIEQSQTALTRELEGMDKAVRDALAAARMPVQGLEITETSVLLDGVPYGQANTARRLTASIGVVVAGLPDDGLRTLWLEDGSLLDDESLALIETIAIENHCQIIVERVMHSEGEALPNAIVMIDGKVHAPDDDAFAMA